MKVENDKALIQLDPKLTQPQRDGASQKVGQQGAQAQVPAEKVSLSEDATHIRQIEKDLSKIPDVRQDLVNRFKAEVENGQYARSSEEVADKIISTSLIESLYR